MLPFRDRADAGRHLAAHLSGYAGRPDVIVLGLPRGGIIVAAEVAARLRAPLEVCLVGKLGVPWQEELAMGAIAEGGVTILNRDVIDQLSIPVAVVEQAALPKQRELERRAALYRGGRHACEVKGRTAIVVDDGLATGATMEAAIQALRRQSAARIIVAVPVGARDTCQRLGGLADEVVCLATPEPFRAVGLWYTDFDQTEDSDVVTALTQAG